MWANAASAARRCGVVALGSTFTKFLDQLECRHESSSVVDGSVDDDPNGSHAAAFVRDCTQLIGATRFHARHGAHVLSADRRSAGTGSRCRIRPRIRFSLRNDEQVVLSRTVAFDLVPGGIAAGRVGMLQLRRMTSACHQTQRHEQGSDRSRLGPQHERAVSPGSVRDAHPSTVMPRQEATELACRHLGEIVHLTLAVRAPRAIRRGRERAARLRDGQRTAMHR